MSRYDTLIKHRFASHVCQTIFTVASDTISREVKPQFLLDALYHYFYSDYFWHRTREYFPRRQILSMRENCGLSLNLSYLFARLVYNYILLYRHNTHLRILRNYTHLFHISSWIHSPHTLSVLYSFCFLLRSILLIIQLQSLIIAYVPKRAQLGKHDRPL